jgi:hypothetical protein
MLTKNEPLPDSLEWSKDKRPDKHLWDQEAEIRHALKAFSEHNTFRLDDIGKRQNTVFEQLRSSKHDEADVHNALHRSWADADDNRKSVVSVLEQYRTRFTAFGLIYPFMLSLAAPSDDPACYHVTLARDDDAIRLVHARNLKSPAFYSRRVADALRRLPNCQALIVTELSFSTIENTRPRAEPHVHALVFGASEDLLRNELRRQGSSDKNQLRIVPVLVADLAATLSYLLKFKAEHRSGYRDENGRLRRRDNKPTPQMTAAWQSYFLQYRISKVLTFVGFQPTLTSDFRSCDLQRACDEMIRNKPEITA